MRILYWNIQQFGINKFNNADILDVLGGVFFPGGLAAVADIFVIVEVIARNEGLGDVPTGTGAAGLAALANEISNLDPNYLCIPPLSLATGGGQAEAIGVFYNSAVLNFVGPMVWSNFGPVPAAEIGHHQANATPPWNQLLGPPPDVFATAAYPAPWSAQAPFGGMGDRAPQIDFPGPGPAAFLEFPNANRRRPLRCQFTYNGGANGLDLWVVHLPPYANPAGAALAQLASSPDIAAAPAANVMRIVCGDFNLNTRNAYQLGLFAPMTGLGYTLQIGGVGGLLPAYPPPATMYKHPCSWDNYMNGLSVDNALTWAGAGMAMTGIAVVDVVAGAPAPPFATELQTPLGAYPMMAGNPTQVFRAWANYGHIGNRPATGNMAGRRGASDHMPLYIRF